MIKGPAPLEPTPDEGPVDLPDPVLRKRGIGRLQGLLIQGEEQHPARRLVEAVTGIHLPPQLFPQQLQAGPRLRLVNRRPVHQQPRRLVHGGVMIILVQDLHVFLSGVIFKEDVIPRCDRKRSVIPGAAGLPDEFYGKERQLFWERAGPDSMEAMKLRWPTPVLFFVCLTVAIPLQGNLSQATHAPPEWTSSNPPFFAYEDLVSNYWELYPRGEDVVIESIRPLEKAVGLELTLRSTRPDFRHFVYTLDGGPEKTSTTGVIRLVFEDDHTLEDWSVERRELRLWLVTEDGRDDTTWYLNSNYYPSEMYHSRGRTKQGHSRIHIRETNMEMATSPVEDWILDEPDAEAVAFAKGTWGHLVDPEQQPYANARRLARVLVKELTPFRGTPSNVMDGLDPFAQYRRLIAGEDACWCANIAEIFSYACNAFGIPTRFIIMRHQLYPPPPEGEDGYEILMATGHTTNEVFDQATGRWIWMDLTYNTFGAWLGKQGPLNMLEFHRFLNQPADYDDLQIEVYDPETDTLARIPLAESDLVDRVRNAFKQDQLFRYMRRPK